MENCDGCWVQWSSAHSNLLDSRAAKTESGAKTGEANFNFRTPSKSKLNLVAALAEGLKWLHPFRCKFYKNFPKLICTLMSSTGVN